MHRYVLFATLLVAGSFQSVGQEPLTAGTADLVVPVWPEAPPTWKAPTEKERDTSTEKSGKIAGQPLMRLGFVSKPELHVFRAEKKQSTGTVVLIAPGGGYSILAWDLEGTEIAQWLQGIGVTAIVVKYRVPTRESETKWLAAVQDIQRSVSLVRSGAIEGVDAKAIGVLGFSAGGNASARVATATKRHYQPVDSADATSASPDFGVLIYSAWLNQKEDPHQLDRDFIVHEKSPPMFLAAAQDDRKYVMSSVTMFRALSDHGVKASLHVFERGGHGFGGRTAGLPTDAWRGLCETWMRDQGWVSK
ncbi:MAG: alpha/beta hydrolase [Rubripirellula sp.]